MTLLRDANGQALAYVYFEDEPGRRAAAAADRDKQGVAVNIRQAAERLRS